MHLRELLSDRIKSNYGKGRDTIKPARCPCFTINMIFGGVEENGITLLVARKTKISLTHGKRIGEIPEDE